MDKDRYIVLKGKQVINGNASEPIPEGVVVIQGKMIKEVGSKKEVLFPQDAEIIDLGNCTLLPGLIDCHLHLSANNALTFNNYRVAMFEVTPELLGYYSLLHAQMCFEMGFTTLRNLGWITYAGHDTAQAVALRDAIRLGIVPGPRILVAGWATITNSHLDVILPKSAPRRAGMCADGPWGLRQMVREKLRLGCDVIKTCASGGGGTDNEAPDIRNMTQEELDAIVDEAHAFHCQCACHCFTPETQLMAIKAGVDTIEHCVFTNEEALNALKEEEKIIVTTLAHRSDKAIELRRKMGTSEFVLNKMKMIQPYSKETFQRLYAHGIKIALGTDTQIDPQMGSNAIEMEIFVDYGMKPMEAIQTATRNAAEAIWMDREIGTLEKGKLADVLAVEGDPLADITIFQDKKKIKMVMKDGQIFVDRRPKSKRSVIQSQDWKWEIPL